MWTVILVTTVCEAMEIFTRKQAERVEQARAQARSLERLSFARASCGAGLDVCVVRCTQ
jgi:hypothetical protein